MSSHKNVLKLLGCCLEFPDPVLVYEYAEIGPLNSWGGTNTNIESKRLLSWKTRLKVAKGIANALTYLHGAFSRPIIHRNIKPQTVMLDENFVAKLCDFSWSILIPQGEMVAKDEIVGSLGFVDPAYFGTGCVAEQTDVYGFGVFMIVLITGRNACDLSLPENSTNICSYVNHMIEQNCVTQIIDPKILEEEGGVNQERQLHAFLGLALKCTQIKREDRPLMIQVTKQLCQIENLKQ
ncbi:non-functional pseudokinase ZED1 [Morus notabilis]|nr:non-functional pseudokinase ZED1 [Morus notabilis]